MSFWLFVGTARLFYIRYGFTTIETFQMMYCTKFYLKGQQNYNNSNSKVPNRLRLFGKLVQPKV